MDTGGEPTVNEGPAGERAATLGAAATDSESGGFCYHCGAVAAVIVTHLHDGPRAYCAEHFLALGSLPSGTACRPTLQMRRCA